MKETLDSRCEMTETEDQIFARILFTRLEKIQTQSPEAAEALEALFEARIDVTNGLENQEDCPLVLLESEGNPLRLGTLGLLNGLLRQNGAHYMLVGVYDDTTGKLIRIDLENRP